MNHVNAMRLIKASMDKITLERILGYQEKSDNSDRMLYRRIINEYHKYKNYTDYPGRRIDYFVKLNGNIIGVTGIASAMLAISPRDNFIGWDRSTRLRNLGKIANNYRFCMIERGYGSRVLSLLAKQGKVDWFKKYREKLVLFETMVEPPFSGTVYKSASWVEVGKTKGQTFRRRVSRSLHMRGSKKRADLVKAGKYEDGHYKHCGSTVIEKKAESIPKIIFVRPLHRNWKKILNR